MRFTILVSGGLTVEGCEQINVRLYGCVGLEVDIYAVMMKLF
jgi:hypothetical protein